MVSKETYIFIGVGVFLALMIAAVIAVTVIVGRRRGWSPGTTFGMYLLGMFSPPIWLILIIYLEVKKYKSQPNTDQSNMGQSNIVSSDSGSL